MGEIRNFGGMYGTLDKNSAKFKELVSLIDILTRFCSIHKINEKTSEEIIGFAHRHSPLSVFSESFSWRPTPEGYDFYYFLNLRWLLYLYNFSYLYPHLINKDSVAQKLNSCLNYSDRLHDEERCKYIYRPIDYINKRLYYDRIIRKICGKVIGEEFDREELFVL